MSFRLFIEGQSCLPEIGFRSYKRTCQQWHFCLMGRKLAVIARFLSNLFLFLLRSFLNVSMSRGKCQFKKIFWCTVDVVFWSSLSTSIFQFSQFSDSVYLKPVPWKLYLMHYLLLTFFCWHYGLSLSLFPHPPRPALSPSLSLLWKSSVLVVLSCPLNARKAAAQMCPQCSWSFML